MVSGEWMNLTQTPLGARASRPLLPALKEEAGGTPALPGSLRVKPRFRPCRLFVRTAKLKAVMQPERPLVPEFHHGGHDAVADPEWRSRGPPAGGMERREGNGPLGNATGFSRGP